MKILICGSRDFDRYDLLEQRVNRVLSYLNISTSDVDCIIQGGANGADVLGARFANLNNIKCVEVPAKWNVYGRSAGYKRNIEMLDMLCKDDLVLAFQVNNSKGTQHTIDNAQHRALQTYVFKFNRIKK